MRYRGVIWVLWWVARIDPSCCVAQSREPGYGDSPPSQALAQQPRRNEPDHRPAGGGVVGGLPSWPLPSAGCSSVSISLDLLQNLYLGVKFILSSWSWVILYRNGLSVIGLSAVKWWWMKCSIVLMGAEHVAKLGLATSMVAVLHVHDPSSVATANQKNSTESRSSSDQNLQHSLYGLNIPKKHFRLWVGYHLGGDDAKTRGASGDESMTSRVYLVLRRAAWQKSLRQLWRTGHLLGDALTTPRNLVGLFVRPKALLASMGDLYMTVLADELEDDRDHGKLMDFLRAEYGPHNVTRLEAAHWTKEPTETQLRLRRFELIMQAFLDWFRSTFPYYRGACDNAACGASGTPPASTTTTTTSAPIMQSQSTFLGLSCANHTEATTGKAAVVEYFSCPTCGVVTRSPRYNAALAICNSRRGRCGEFNLLILRMLQALGHSCRWVYDKGNGHIWSEVQWGEDRHDRCGGSGESDPTTTRTAASSGCIENCGHDDDEDNNSTRSICGRQRRWLHLDPCEAAVNQNLLYEQQWGRTMTTVFAFCAPPFCGTSSPANDDRLRQKVDSESPILLTMIPTIEDVTDRYRSKNSPPYHGGGSHRRPLTRRRSLCATRLWRCKKKAGRQEQGKL